MFDWNMNTKSKYKTSFISYSEKQEVWKNQLYLFQKPKSC